MLEWEEYARGEGKEYIIEKTPKHVQRIKNIKKLTPEAKIILIKRNPLDTIASLYKRFGNLSICIKRYNLDNYEIIKWRDESNIYITSYEYLIESPEDCLKKISNFVGVKEFEDIANHRKESFSKNQKDENMYLRLKQISQPIDPGNSGKWREVFDKKTANYILDKTSYVRKCLGYNDFFYP